MATALAVVALIAAAGLNFESWFGATGNGHNRYVPSVQPSDFVSRYVFPEGYVERTEYTLDPTAPFPATSEDVVQVERIAFGYLESQHPSSAFNIALSLVNTTARPIQLDITPRFFELADDQGRRAELVYFCCEARGELLGSGERRRFQLIYRSLSGWEGKEITTRMIHFRISGLIPLVRGVWSFRPLATAD